MCTLMMQTSAFGGTANVPTGQLSNVSVFANVNLDNQGTSIISGDVNVNTSTSLLGLALPAGLSLSGLFNTANDVSAQVKADCNVAIANAISRPTTLTISGDLGGRVLASGVYSADVMKLTGTLTLDAKGDPNAVFIFKARSNLLINANAFVKLINGANSDRVFWATEADATLGVSSQFVGRLLAIRNILAQNGAKVRGSLLACNGSVDLNSNTISTPAIVGATVDVDTPNTPSAGVDGIDDTVIPAVTPTTTPAGGNSAGARASDESDGSTLAVGSNSTEKGTPRKSASGILAFTGRNALTIASIAIALLGAGWGIAMTVKRRHAGKVDKIV